MGANKYEELRQEFMRKKKTDHENLTDDFELRIYNLEQTVEELLKSLRDTKNAGC